MKNCVEARNEEAPEIRQSIGRTARKVTLRRALARTLVGALGATMVGTLTFGLGAPSASASTSPSAAVSNWGYDENWLSQRSGSVPSDWAPPIVIGSGEWEIGMDTLPVLVTPAPLPPPLTPAERATERAGRSVQAASRSGNGMLGPDVLCGLTVPGHQLRCDAAAGLEQAIADGMPTSELTDTYRPFDAQVRAKAQKPVLAATPGTSNHGWGLAIDIHGATQSWLRANGAKYGWVQPSWALPGGSKPESWHFEFVGIRE